MHSRQGYCLPVLTTLLALAISPATPAAIYRCQDAAGHPGFSDQPCPADQQGTSISLPPLNRIAAPDTRSSGSGAERHDSQRSRRTRQPQDGDAPATAQGRIITTGERMDACGNPQGEPRLRRAMVEGRVLAGMSSSTVEQTLGRPDRTSQSGGHLRYHYEAGRGHRAQTIQFDEDGCVTSKGKRRTPD